MTAILDAPAVVDTDVSFDALRAELTGSLHTPDEPEYDALVSPWNLAVPMRPAAVVAVRTAEDVAAAVRFAGAHGFTAGVQATGHGAERSLAGHLLVLTKGLDEVTVHPEGWARVGAGVKWSQARRGGRTLRPRRGQRLHHRRRHRRLHDRRRRRPAGPDLRHQRRPGARLRGRHRRRRLPAGDPDRVPGPVLRPPRRQGRRRHRDRARVRPDPHADLLRRGGLLRRRRRGRGDRPVAGLGRRAAGAGDDVVRDLPAAPAAGRPAAAGRPDDPGRPVRVDRRAGGGRAAAGRDPGRRAGDPGRREPAPLHRDRPRARRPGRPDAGRRPGDPAERRSRPRRPSGCSPSPATARARRRSWSRCGTSAARTPARAPTRAPSATGRRRSAC